mmetsp:Transcript_22709/g.78148  ORF Transcript_22709/g.78148 Transcript_22709/m.78148 type:complete len:295 (+) Transcript_22709:37-921(+)
MSRLMAADASSNLPLSSKAPIANAADASWRRSSSRRRMTRITVPSKASVTFMTSTNLAPLAHSKRSSIMSGLNLSTYSSTSTAIFASCMALPTSFAAAWSLAKGAKSCLRTLGGPASPLRFSPKTMQDRSAAMTGGSRSPKTPSSRSSAMTSSSAVLSSQAARPLRAMTASSDTWPSRFRTLRMRRRSSRSTSSCASAAALRRARASSTRAWRAAKASTGTVAPGGCAASSATSARSCAATAAYSGSRAASLRSSSSRSVGRGSPPSPPKRFSTSTTDVRSFARSCGFRRSWGM